MSDDHEKRTREEAVIQLMLALRSLLGFAGSMARSLHNLETRGVLVQLPHETEELTNRTKEVLGDKLQIRPRIRRLTHLRRRGIFSREDTLKTRARRFPVGIR